ncbi:hypothetical protein TWF102_002993 [Orbilia oligospora]|uniref:Uncharacterized protein n=1 Tax=Orbilia oligospora TaxID=2813651 RepID=A0A7C8J5C4_ORBOL|nr:hypothetical protein TWF102_002993 [Orbilia oligospora]
MYGKKLWCDAHCMQNAQQGEWNTSRWILMSTHWHVNNGKGFVNASLEGQLWGRSRERMGQKFSSSYYALLGLT